MKKTKEAGENIGFGNPYYSNTENYEPLEEEVFQVQKGNVVTTILCKFSKEGVMVSWHHTSTYAPVIKSKPTKLKGTFKKRG